MNLVDGPLAAALAVLCRAVDVAALGDDLGMACRVPTPDDPRGYVVGLVPWDHFDELVAAGLVELIGEDEFEVSGRGRYWYDRSEKANERKRRAR